MEDRKLSNQTSASPVDEDAGPTTERATGVCPPIMPKHIPFPTLPHNSELLSELVLFLFISCSAAMQFINIYRTVWWTPDSHINHTVNFYLIEPYLILVILVMSGRRLVYCLLLRTLEIALQRNKQLRLYRRILRYSFAALLLSLLGFSIMKIYARHTYLSLFLLIYPFIVYMLIFGFRIEPFLRSSCELEGFYLNGMPLHCCSTSPASIRDEIDVLRNDFNDRFKQVIFTSLLNAYYAGAVPCFFAVSVHYNIIWATQHILFIWLSGMTMCTAFLFPSKYSDVLHRAALHLGYWCRVDGVAGSAAAQLIAASAVPWNKGAMWTNGSVVRHSGELFRSRGPVTVALPGNTTHTRFYRLFLNPAVIYMTLTTVQATIVLTELFLLYLAIEWHFVLSISFVTLTNQFTFFKIMRDCLITRRVYTAEAAIGAKQTN